MPTLKMSKDKILTITKSGNTYEDENNAEIIKILFPQEVNNIDLSNCVVHLCMLNQDNLGDEVNISSNLKEYDDELYTANIDITNKITYKAGEIKLWINILNSNNQMIAKTNPVTYQIKKHLDIEDYIPEQNLSLLNDFTLRMENLVNVAEEAVSKPPIAGNNGNWYVWDASIGDYKDSGISINIDLTEYVKVGDLNNTLERANEYTDKATEETKSYVDSEIAKIPTGGGGSDDKLFTYEPQLEITTEEAVNTITINEINGISLDDYNYTAIKCVVENAVLETAGRNAQVTVYVNSKAFDTYQTPMGSPTTFINANTKRYWGCYADIKSGLLLSGSSSQTNETWTTTYYMPINSQNLHLKDKIEYLNISILMGETFPIGTKFRLWFK